MITAFAESRQGARRRLFDAVLIILGQAADRPDLMLLPVPTAVTVDGDVLQQLLRELLDRGLLEEVKVMGPEQAWRHDGEGQFGLRITPAGLAAVGYPALQSGLAEARVA